LSFEGNFGEVVSSEQRNRLRVTASASIFCIESITFHNQLNTRVRKKRSRNQNFTVLNTRKLVFYYNNPWSTIERHDNFAHQIWCNRDNRKIWYENLHNVFFPFESYCMYLNDNQVPQHREVGRAFPYNDEATCDKHFPFSTKRFLVFSTQRHPLTHFAD
jgi:hypothetical protein